MIRSKVAGVSYKNDNGTDRQDIIRRFCRAGTPIGLKREPHNPYSLYAVSVWVRGRALLFVETDLQIGYLSNEVARKVAPRLDAGQPVYARVSEITGGSRDKPTRGVNLEIKFPAA